MLGKFEVFIYFAVVLQVAVNDEEYPSTFGTKFVTLFPWDKGIWSGKRVGQYTFEVINPSKNKTANITFEWKSSQEKRPPDSINISPLSNIMLSYKEDGPMGVLQEEEGNQILRSLDARIVISATSEISIIQCFFTPDENGDCFTILPITMAGRYYAFTATPRASKGAFTAYFIPTVNDAEITAVTVTKKHTDRNTFISRVHRGSIIYAYNSSMDEDVTLYATSETPFLIILTMQTYLQAESRGHFGCTMLSPLPDEVCARTTLWSDFDVHFAALDPSKDFQTQLMLAAPRINCQPFTVTSFRRSDISSFTVKPETIQNHATKSWHYKTTDSTIGYKSSDALFQVLRFDTYKNNGSFLDIVPSYSQYLTGKTPFILRGSSERLFLFDFPRAGDTLLLDGKEVVAELDENFDNPFRSIRLRKINTKELKSGLHFFESTGKYLFFVYSGSEKVYGYVPAFNVYPAYLSKWIEKSDPGILRQDIYGTSFVTLFPMMEKDSFNASIKKVIQFDIVNPHSDKIAYINISLHSPNHTNKVANAYDIKPNKNLKIEFNEESMTILKSSPNGIFTSHGDPRIKITSSLPISVTQHCFFADGVGDSFMVLPTEMAGKRYSFSLPNSIANNSYAIIYFLPVVRVTHVHIRVRTKSGEKFRDIKAAMEGPIYAYYGLAEESAVNVWGNQRFHVIVTVQRLLLEMAAITDHRVDFGCTMAVSVMKHACKKKAQEPSYDVHYLMIATNLNSSAVFTLAPSNKDCPGYRANSFPAAGGHFSRKQMLFDPEQLQKHFEWHATTFSRLQAIVSGNDFIQIYNFGYSNVKGGYIDFVPSVAQYTTGRTYFVTGHPKVWIMIFMDEDAANDMELDGAFIAHDLILEISSPHSSGYFALQNIEENTKMHYIQSKGRYIFHILSDNEENGFYGYYGALNKHAKLLYGEIVDVKPIKVDEYDTLLLEFLPLGNLNDGEWMLASELKKLSIIHYNQTSGIISHLPNMFSVIITGSLLMLSVELL